MLDQLRREIQIRLDELLGEADKLRRALAALGSRDHAATPSPSATPPAAPERARQAPTSRPATRKPARATLERHVSRYQPFTAAGRAARRAPGPPPDARGLCFDQHCRP